jgi:sugar lactone lactonase YvrE
VGLVWQRTGDDAGRETVSAAVSSDTTTGRPRFFTVDADGTLWSQIAGASGSRLDLGISRVVATQVAAGPGGQLYVAVRASGDAAGSRDVSWIVRLFTQ